MDVDVDQVMAHLQKTAAAEGLAMGDRRRTYNSRLAQEAGLWAQRLGKGHAFHTAAFKAYFVDGRNLARKEVVMDLIRAAGLDPDAGEKVIDGRTFAKAVDADWDPVPAKTGDCRAHLCHGPGKTGGGAASGSIGKNGFPEHGLTSRLITFALFGWSVPAP